MHPRRPFALFSCLAVVGLVLPSLEILGLGATASASDVEVFAADEVYTGDVEAFLDFALRSDDFEQVLAESETLSRVDRDLVCLVAARAAMDREELNRRLVAIGWPGPYFGVGPVDEGDKLHGAMPQYSEEARAQRIEGRVSAHIALDQTGRPRSLYLEGDPLLRAAAARTFVGWRFEPARLDGDPVPVCRYSATSFQLQ